MADTHKNFAKGTLTNSPGTAGTSFVLGAGEGANFAANMPVTIVPDQTQPDSTNAEIGYVTAVATDTLTVTRAQQSTTAKNAQAGWLVLGTITAKALTDIETELDTHEALTAAHGTTGAVVGTTDTQTLSNKTLTTPTIASFTNATHDHTSASGGGTLSLNSATTGTLTVNRGGTGTTTLTGIVKGNGTTAFTAATAGTDYVSPSSTETLTNKTLTNPVFTGNSGLPTAPSAGTGKLYGIGTSNLNLGWMGESGTQINITSGLGAWTAWTPTVTSGSGSFSSVSGSGRYTQIGKTVIWKVDITVTTVGTASGAVLFTLPITANYSTGMIGSGREDALSGKALTCKLVSSTQASSLNYDNTSAIGAGSVMRLSGQYEAA